MSSSEPSPTKADSRHYGFHVLDNLSTLCYIVLDKKKFLFLNTFGHLLRQRLLPTQEYYRIIRTTMNEHQLHFNQEWQELLSANQINNFDDFWTLNGDLVDEGNQGRGSNGWSHVLIYRLKVESEHDKKIVIKRQNNYRSRTLCHPLIGIATFIREFNSIQNYKKLGIPTLNPIYCATRKAESGLQTILVTEFLEGYTPLDDEICSAQKSGRRLSPAVIKQVARTVANLHKNRLEHRCLYPKHIFINTQNPDQEAVLIDLEATRWKPWKGSVNVRDLATLARHCKMLGNRERLSFLFNYLETERVDEQTKQLWKQVAKKNHKKSKKKKHAPR